MLLTIHEITSLAYVPRKGSVYMKSSNILFRLQNFAFEMFLIKHAFAVSSRVEKMCAKTFNGLFQFIISLETDNSSLFRGISDIITDLRVPILNNHYKFNHFSIFNPITLNWNSLKRSITSTL